MTNFLNQAGIAHPDPQCGLEIDRHDPPFSFVLMYLAIGKGFEPLLLLPIAFCMLLTVNLPG